ATNEPLRPGSIPLQDFRVRLDPVQVLGLLCPERFWVGFRTVVNGGIIEVRLRDKVRRRWVPSIFLQERGDRPLAVRGRAGRCGHGMPPPRGVCPIGYSAGARRTRDERQNL